MMWPFRKKENPINKSIIAMVGGGSVAYTPKDYRSLSKAGYEMCAAVYACVKLIANTASRIPWYAQRVGSNGDVVELESHPIIRLLERPNEVESGPRFTEKILSHLLLAGNSYVLRVSGTPGQAPQFLYTLRPDRVQVNPDKTGRFLVQSYTYTAASAQTFPSDDVMHMMEFHPTEDFYGLSRIEVAALQIDTMNWAAEWNASRLKKDMVPPGMLTAKSNWDLDTLKKMFAENYQGATNAGTPLAFSGEDIKWQDISVNPKDMDWLKGQLFTLRQICSIYGVDPCLVGDAEYATLSNKQEARKGLYQEVVLPLMDLLRDEYQRWLVPLYKTQGLQLEYDRDSIQELQEDVKKRNDALAVARWMTVNEKRVACGLEEMTDGDVLDAPAAPTFGAPAAGAASSGVRLERKSFWRDPARAEALWTAFDTRARRRGKTYEERAAKYIKAQTARVQLALESFPTIATVNISEVLDVAREAKLYAEEFNPWYRDHFIRAGEAGIRAAKGELFDDGEFKADKPTTWTFKLTPAQEERLQQMVFNSGTKVNETTIEIIYEELKRAQAENEPVAKFSQALGDKIDELSRGRIDNWARTESTKVDNYGQVEGFRETEFVGQKGWLCSFLPTSREDHENASGQEVGLDDPFRVGSETLDYPGDPAGSAGNVCNCACSVYPVVGG